MKIRERKYIKQILIFILIILFFNNCTIRQYTTKNYIYKSKFTTIDSSHNFLYYVEINSVRRYRTLGIKHQQSYMKEYLKSIQKIFKQNDFSAKYESDKNKANFIIEIKEQPYASALGQEFLTGLSLGLIPSWGTRKSEYIFKFIDNQHKISHKYSIDDTRFNHIILFPVFWLSFSDNKIDVFEKTLINFIDTYANKNIY